MDREKRGKEEWDGGLGLERGGGKRREERRKGGREGRKRGRKGKKMGGKIGRGRWQ